jgi:hypothetical protein
MKTMDTTIQHYLNLISKSPGKDYWKNKKYAKEIMKDVWSYRFTAYLTRGRNVSSLCNFYANQIERQLDKTLGDK